jgi:hypothetical protein
MIRDAGHTSSKEVHIMKMLLTIVTAVSMALAASTAVAKSYTGNWPVTIKGSADFNGPHCVELSGGSALLDDTYYGEFQVIGRTILVFLDITGSGEEPASLLFSSPADKGNIGKGAFDEIQGGTSYDSGTTVFGTKGGC